MIKLTPSNFIEILYDTIMSSPTTFVTILLGIVFLIIMIVNMKRHKKIGKIPFIIGWVFIIAFVVFKYSPHLTTLFDNLINNIFMQVFFPNLASYIILLALTNFIFLFTILKKDTKTIDKIINSIFFLIIMLFFILSLERVTQKNINIYETLTVYSDKNLLILIEATTITFVIWMIILISKMIIIKLIQKSDDKVKGEYQINGEGEDNNVSVINEEINTDSNVNLVDEEINASNKKESTNNKQDEEEIEYLFPEQ